MAVSSAYTRDPVSVRGARMLFKLLVVILLLFVVSSLFSGFYFLMKDSGSSDRVVKALTVRIALSMVLFIFLMIGHATGLITPHGIGGG